MQVHGGSGFTEHFPASQYLRDARITMIYEGTNGIQALDLIGRKLPAKNGARDHDPSWPSWKASPTPTKTPATTSKPFVDAVRESKDRLQDAAMWLMQNGTARTPTTAAAASVRFHAPVRLLVPGLHVGHHGQGLAGQDRRGRHRPYYANKLITARYYIERVLPDAASHLAKLKTGADTMMSMPVEAF
jgi:hypothetical protein